MYNHGEGYKFMFKKLAQKLSLQRKKQAAINPIDVDFEARKSLFLNKLTKNALDMYERSCDIKNFSKLVLSDPENDSHDKLVERLFQEGVIDAGDDERLLELSDNRRFLRDLGLTED